MIGFITALIPNQYLMIAKIAAIVIVLLTAFIAGWSVNGWRLNSKYESAERERIEASIKAQKEAQLRVAEADKKYVEDMANAEKTIRGLRYCISHGTCRVSVPGKPLPTTGNTGSADGKARCELDGTVTNDLISIAEDGDKAIRKLTALQKIIGGK